MDSDIAATISTIFSLNKQCPMKPYLKRKQKDNEDEEFYQQFFVKRKSRIPQSLVENLKSQQKVNLSPDKAIKEHLVVEPAVDHKIMENGIEIDEGCSPKRNESITESVLEKPNLPNLEQKDEVIKPTEIEIRTPEIQIERSSDLSQETSEIETIITDSIIDCQAIADTTNFTKTLNDKEFMEWFHVSKSTVELICSKISPILETFYTDKIPNDLLNIVLISLNFLSNQQTLQEIAERFNISVIEVESFLLNFCRSVSQMHDEFIRWPVEEEFEQNELTFKTNGNKDIDGVFGCIDSQGFKIISQKNNPNLFLNLNGVPNIYVQGVCNANHLFLDCFIGWPGSFGKQNVLENSPIYRKLERSRSSIPAKFHLIGNTYYQSRPYLVTPYSNDDLKPSQLRFNNLLQSKLVVFNETIAMLKDRFQRLFYVDILVLDDAKNIILTACCLHNLCIEQKDFYESESDEDHLEKRDFLAASIKF